MKQVVEQLLENALLTLKTAGTVPADFSTAIQVDRTKDESHGDFATNLALILAKPCRLAPRMVAEQLIKAIGEHPEVLRMEIAGPGFINFFLQPAANTKIIATIINEQDKFGHSNIGKGQKVLVEFVSANPTGPLHVGHGRGSAFGASLAALLKTTGHEVATEYYVNDAGRQMSILAVSAWLRYLSLEGQNLPFPVNAYKGNYVIEIAKAAQLKIQDKYLATWETISQGLPKDEIDGGDKEKYIDAVILRMKDIIGEEGFQFFHQLCLQLVLDDIKEDLSEFGVTFDQWFSEQSLLDEGAITKSVEALTKAGHTYEKAGALWFNATAFGDEKDRVLIRSNGQSTYFASDVAYHWQKFDRGFTRLINIFGADHHGYIKRLQSAVQALGHDDEAIQVLLVQFAILYKGTERVQMSTRSGSFVTLRELRQEVSNDAARFFYVMRKSEQHMDFDLDLAKSESNDNPVYYIQYAHARICSVLKQLKERGFSYNQERGVEHLSLLTTPQEQTLITLLGRYPETINAAALALEPHQIAYYLRELATGLHSYYNAVVLLCEDEVLRDARLCLLSVVRIVLANGLKLLGVHAPQSM